MNKLITSSIALITLISPVCGASPREDLQQFRLYFQNRFPSLSLNAFSNGVYAINADARTAWQDIEEFPLYDEAITKGQLLFETPFQNGGKYSDCFEKEGLAIAHKYPYWDNQAEQVTTLPLAINNCRTKNGEPALSYQRGEMAYLLSYMAYTSRGQKIAIKVPPKEEKALQAYYKGKAFYYNRRGQLNFSCASCHTQNSGLRIRSETISPSLGHTTGWPVYRAKWGEMGTLHRRFIGCNKQARAKTFAAQSEEYRNLEYFLSYMSNGLPMNGPSYRK
jgi:sulfur-oxidizing protein SoxA